MLRLVVNSVFAVNSYHVTTPTNQDYEAFRISTHKHLFLFDVKACSHQIVALSNGTHVTYELQIDFNGELILQPVVGGGAQAKVAVTLLDCEVYK